MTGLVICAATVRGTLLRTVGVISEADVTVDLFEQLSASDQQAILDFLRTL